MPATTRPPLIMGATGRLGRAFRRLWDRGLWPGRSEPLWMQRPGHAANGHPVDGNAIVWDHAGPPPADYRLHMTQGIIVLAGATSGDGPTLAANTDAAMTALALRRIGVAGPVLLMSSAAVYGRGVGPLTEDGICTPANAYGAAKLAMEQAVAGMAGVTCLRLANVAGSDALFGAMARGPVTLDRFADGAGPWRSYIGPVTLAGLLLDLLARDDLPGLLNVAAPTPVAMQDVLDAAGAAWNWTPAPATALPRVALDTGRLLAMRPLAVTDAPALVAEAQAAGWGLSP